MKVRQAEKVRKGNLVLLRHWYFILASDVALLDYLVLVSQSQLWPLMT